MGSLYGLYNVGIEETPYFDDYFFLPAFIAAIRCETKTRVSRVSMAQPCLVRIRTAARSSRRLAISFSFSSFDIPDKLGTGAAFSGSGEAVPDGIVEEGSLVVEPHPLSYEVGAGGLSGIEAQPLEPAEVENEAMA